MEGGVAAAQAAPGTAEFDVGGVGASSEFDND
jgi:hypothetical protein